MTQQTMLVREDLSPTQLTKTDLATVTAVYKAQARKFDRWGVAGVLGGLSIGMLLMVAGSAFGWGDKWDPFFFFAGWGIAFGAITVGWRRHRAALADLQVHCSHCSAPLIQTPKFLRPSRPALGLSRAELIVTTGCCPSCGHEFLSSEA